MTHIGGYPPKYAAGVKAKLTKLHPDVFICGHSHVLRVMRDPMLAGMLYLNPGAVGIEGFHKVRTLLRFSIENSTIKELEVVELGKRARGHNLAEMLP